MSRQDVFEQVGISLGGIILGHYLVREGGAAKVEAALLVSGKLALFQPIYQLIDLILIVCDPFRLTMLAVCFDTFEGCNSLEGDWLNRQLNRYHPTLQQV